MEKKGLVFQSNRTRGHRSRVLLMMRVMRVMMMIRRRRVHTAHPKGSRVQHHRTVRGRMISRIDVIANVIGGMLLLRKGKRTATIVRRVK